MPQDKPSPSGRPTKRVTGDADTSPADHIDTETALLFCPNCGLPITERLERCPRCNARQCPTCG